MVCPYENAADASQHLRETVIMYDDRPCWVEEVFDLHGVITATLHMLPRLNNPVQVSIFDPLFDAKGMGQRLGYCNFTQEYGAMYISRIPSRQYKQGLSRNNVHVPAYNGRRVQDFPTMMRGAPFVAMLRREYPSFTEAVQALKANQNPRAIAFSPEFALERDDLGYFLLHFKGERVAWGDPKDFKVPNHYSYLKELLNKYEVPYEA